MWKVELISIFLKIIMCLLIWVILAVLPNFLMALLWLQPQVMWSIRMPRMKKYLWWIWDMDSRVVGWPQMLPLIIPNGWTSLWQRVEQWRIWRNTIWIWPEWMHSIKVWKLILNTNRSGGWTLLVCSLWEIGNGTVMLQDMHTMKMAFLWLRRVLLLQ